MVYKYALWFLIEPNRGGGSVFVQGIAEKKYTAEEGQEPETTLSGVTILCYTDCNMLTLYSYVSPTC